MWLGIISPIPEGKTEAIGPFHSEEAALKHIGETNPGDALEAVLLKHRCGIAQYTDFDEYFSDWPEVRDLFQDEGYDNVSYGDNDLTLVSCKRIKAEFIEPHKDSLMGMGMPHDDYDRLLAKLDSQPDHYINLE